MTKPNGTPPEGGRQGYGSKLRFFRRPLIFNPTGLIAPAVSVPLPFELKEPVRMIRPTWSSFTGMLPFPHLGLGVRHESLLEGELLKVVKGAAPHLAVMEQPIQIDTKALGFKKGNYTPDFLVWVMRDPFSPKDVVLIEVKPEGVLAAKFKKHLRHKFMAAMRFAKQQGWRFKIVSERHLHRPPKVSGSWPRIHQEVYSLTLPFELVSRLFGESVAESLS